MPEVSDINYEEVSPILNSVDLTQPQRIVHHWEMMIDGVQAMNSTPEDLWQGSLKYFKWCDDHPIHKPEVLRSGIMAGKMIYVPTQRPYTISALCLHLGITREYIYDAINSDDQNAFSFVARRIVEIIHTQKLELAIAGVYNPIVVSKELGIGNEKQAGAKSSTINIEVTGSSPALLDNEADIDFPKLKTQNQEDETQNQQPK